MEGHARARHILIEFKDYDTALACYRSPEYERAKKLRIGKGTGDIFVIEGYAGAQP